MRTKLWCAVPLAISLVLLIAPPHAHAVQWQSLNGTSRYKVAFDEQSVRLTAQGRLEVWLRFIPRGEVERRLAATEFKERRYRSHMEFYEIDCSEQSALLGLVDLFGSTRKRLKRLAGGGRNEAILPGSVLDDAARHICPVLDSDSEEDDDPAAESAADRAAPAVPISDDVRRQMEILQKKASAPDAGPDAWRELGNLYFDTDQPELAIAAYDRVLAARPADTDTLNDQGAMYRQLGNFPKALANFDRAFALDPRNLESLFNSAFVRAFDMNDMPNALLLWRRYLEQDQASDMARQVRSYIDQYGGGSAASQ